MAITYVGSGAITGGVGAVTPALPASLAVDDILILSIRSVNGQAATVPTPNGGTWTEFTNSPQDNATDGVRGTWFWSRYNGTQGNPTTNDSGTINIARIKAYRGVKNTGDPFTATAGGTQTAATSMSNPGLTTTVDGSMIVTISVCDRDAASTTNADSWTNGDLASITEAWDEILASGVGGGFASAHGIDTTAGTVGATTWTQAANGGTASLTIALEPAVENRRMQLSWAELEVPNAPRRMQLSWAELEVPNAPRRMQLSWAELEIPNVNTDRRMQLSWAELEVPNAPRRMQLSWAEFQVDSAPRRAQLSWAELEIPDVAAPPASDGAPTVYIVRRHRK